MHRVGAGYRGRLTGTLGAACAIAAIVSCAPRRTAEGQPAASRGRDGRVRPGITVLLNDSIGLVRGRRIGLVTNHTGVDEEGRSDIDLLSSDPRAAKAGVKLVTLFAPEHGIRGTEDRENLESGRDAKTGLPIVSLYTRGTIAPPDSTLRGLDALVFDLPDVGTRTWTYTGLLVYSLRAAKRNGIPLVVLDRPAPLGGDAHQGPMLDTALANPEESTPQRPGQAYALYPTPLRHGMTMGELARFFDGELHIGADLHVVPLRNYRRAMWWDDTGLPWPRPSPNLPSLTSALVYPALVALEGSNLSVGRGTPEAFQQFGAPWLRARETAKLLNDRGLAGVRFEEVHITPQSPGDEKFGGRTIPAVRVVVTNRNTVHVGRVGAAILWAVTKTGGDSLKISTRTFDLRFGDPTARERLQRGDDPDAVIDASLPAVVAFWNNARKYLIYR